MERSVSADAIATIIANPSPDSTTDLPEIVIQVVDLKLAGSRYMFQASDGKKKLHALFQSSMVPEIISGKIQNLGLVRILDYTLNDIPNKAEKYLILTKCEVVSPALDYEIKNEVNTESKPEVKTEGCGLVLKPKLESEVNNKENAIILKPKRETVARSAAQIVNEQRQNMAPVARMAMTRRVHPLISLNPYQGSWTIKVRLTNKGTVRTYKNAKGEGCVFNVELTDDDGTQIQATMFNEAAKKFVDKFQLGKVYYISKGNLKLANKQFSSVKNDYEMTLNENSEVEEAVDEETFIPETKFNFVQIDQLGPYVNGKELVDVIGIVQSVSPTMSIRRKSNNENVPKRDITIADETKRTVTISLWNDLATDLGQELLDTVDNHPIVAIKSLKVGDFQGVTLSALPRSIVKVNPESPEGIKLRSWYESEGKDSTMASVGFGLTPLNKSGSRSMYADQVPLATLVNNPSLGEGKPAFFNVRAYVSFIKPDQQMLYKACVTCKKKVTEAIGSGYWCEGCQKNAEEFSLRYMMSSKISDSSADAWVSAFNEEAEKMIGCSADELGELKSQMGEENLYQMKLKEAVWNPFLFRVSVAPHEYNQVTKQRITIRNVVPIDFAEESRYLLEEIAKMTSH